MHKRARNSMGTGTRPEDKLDDAEAYDSDGRGEGQQTRVQARGRRKIKIEFIADKAKRHITFSKRKAGLLKKAYEISTLTGTQALVLVVSETGLVYTFTTAKLQPLVTQPEGRNLIQACLNVKDGAAIQDTAQPASGIAKEGESKEKMISLEEKGGDDLGSSSRSRTPTQAEYTPGQAAAAVEYRASGPQPYASTSYVRSAMAANGLGMAMAPQYPGWGQ